MKFPFKFKKTSILGLGITLAVITLYFISPSILKFMELKSLDLKFHARGKIRPGPETVIAAIDEKSLDEMGRWPWSRDIQAKMVEKLMEHDAGVIVFDAVFSEPDTNPGLKKIREFQAGIKGEKDAEFINWLNLVEKESDTDRQFADAIRQSQKTVLGYFFHFSKEGLGHLDKKLVERSFDSIRRSHYNAVLFSQDNANSALLKQAYAVESSIPALSEAASGAGFFNFSTDEDGAIRRLPLIVSSKNSFFPPLSIQALKLYLNKEVSFYIREYGVESVEIGDVSIPTDERGRLFINYYGPQHTFPYYSASDILKGRIPQGSLKDKIVLIGATATGIFDLRVTPFQKDYPGLEIHATVIDNILHQRFLMQPEWLALVDILAIFLGGVIVTFFVARRGIFLSLGFTSLIGGIFFWCNFSLFQRGIQTSIIYPLLNLALVHFGITIYRLFTEGREKRFIKGAFGRYLSPAVIEQLVANPNMLKLGGERKILTAFFSDVVGFTTISEKLSPEEVVSLLNVYLTEMTEILMKHGGTVDKFEGDAIIAFFGAPVYFEDHQRRACLASIEMQERLAELRAQWKEEGKPELQMRIGMNTGPMVVGNMGSKNRMDYTMMGDSVNLASRLEGVNKEYGTHVMICEFTREGLSSDIATRELDSIRVVGKKETLKIYELVGKRENISPNKFESLELFQKGLGNYKNRKWDDAIKCFDEVLKRDEDDGPAMTLLERCLEFRSAGEASDKEWDGVFQMNRK